MIPRIETLTEKKLIGMRMAMSVADYKVGELWRNFMPRRKEISNQVPNDLISLVVYKTTHFADFKPTNEFERWATGMKTFVLPGGLYAVFDYIGLSTDNSIFKYIFGTWLPDSNYVIDDRPHFEILGSKYKSNDPNSEEEIWIPIKPR